ncbi:PNP-UDP-1 domain-containing protein [Fusarium falciforme]|uniref:PNP-UDP-1 domain-containing protein n=1 Tax=Fusarium falciforme TaxID=195108 RepID=UPI0022FFDDAA|nr:PNP-UDP-1 domain-containing protein [Fusarium falciforme]WAO86248.1 PNP-UDP-1 domain-containing protein [Fusarium falciforme]
MTSSRDRDAADSLQVTYNILTQIARTLRRGEHDPQLRGFYAELHAYFTVIYYHLKHISSSHVTIDNDVQSQLLDCIESVFTRNFLQLSSDARLRRLDELGDDIQGLADNGAKVGALQPYLDFGATQIERDDFLESLSGLEKELETRYPEDMSQWAPEDFGPLIKINEPSYAVWSAAQSIFKALVACKDCVCTPTHDFGARLCLGTHRKPDCEADDQVDFDMFLSMKEDWHEAHIHTAKDRAVRIVVDQSRQRHRAPRSMVVKQLCEPIARVSTMAGYRLQLKVTKDQLFKLQSERSESLVDKTKHPVSLDQFLRDRPRNFTERTKRILAVILSSTVFHLHNTPWLEPSWNSSNVLFFQTSSSAVTLRPFIQTKLSLLDFSPPHDGREHSPDATDSEDLDPDDFDPDDMDPDDWLMHRCPILVTLAVMLLEIYFATPFDVLARRCKVDLGDPQSSTKHLDVSVVFQACRTEIPENSQFYVAVGSCLDPQVWETEDGGSLSSDELRSRIYEKVVLPLETELSQAYSSISINDLDKFAETLDFASWDQTIQTLNQQTNVEASRQNAELTLGLERSCSLSPSHAAPYHPPGSAQHPELSNRRLSDLDPRATISASSTPNLVRFPSGSDAEAALCDSTASLSLESYPQWKYAVGILCALSKELLAVRALFDTKHSKPKNLRGDVNNYALGTISGHMVVAACLPAGEYGTNAAADSASNMRRSFPSITFCLLVGIGGGAPTPQNDIRLGDVVTGHCTDMNNHIQKRPLRPTDHPEIHYGLIASANRVLKDAAVRDRWAREHGILCFEMEAAGVMNTFPCLVIRGVCDYADSYKSKEWQEYAAATAAAYAKLLLTEVAVCDDTRNGFWEQERILTEFRPLEQPISNEQRV